LPRWAAAGEARKQKTIKIVAIRWIKQAERNLIMSTLQQTVTFAEISAKITWGEAASSVIQISCYINQPGRCTSFSLEASSVMFIVSQQII
jgi:hypothetical protein